MSSESDDVAVHPLGRAERATGFFVAVAMAACVCAVAAAGVSGGRSTRPPTRAERAALTDATHADATVGDTGVSFIRVLVKDPRFAIVAWGHPADPVGWLHTSLYGRSRGHWHLLYWIEGPRGHQASPDGACAVASAAIVWMLYHYRCSFTYAELHGRPATTTEAEALQLTLIRYSSGSTLGPQRIRNACISRVDPAWAAANGANHSTGLVWFRRARSKWHVAYQEGGSPKPPHAILLSLGSCVGYFPSDFYP